MKSLVFIKKIYQTGNTTFEILWSDDRISSFHLSHLQRNCPCVRCRDGKVREEKGSDVERGLRATRIVNVGAYALKIDFTSGCSRGIFTYSFLRKLSLGDV
jgi:ATP-binding protein involved in chromosome partitioning